MEQLGLHSHAKSSQRGSLLHLELRTRYGTAARMT
jgi:hypothetical protein